MLHEGGTICELLHVHEWLYGEHPPLLASIGSQKSSLSLPDYIIAPIALELLSISLLGGARPLYYYYYYYYY